MTGTMVVTGIVLNSMMIGEYDRRLTILTREKGKISVFAKGARRPNSALLACSQPFTYADFTLYVGKNSYNIMNVDNVNYFSELRTDIAAMYYGMYFCELSDYFTREGNDESDMLKLLYISLLALTKRVVRCELVKLIFELKAITIYGEAPETFECMICHEECPNSERWYFSSVHDGVICHECRLRAGSETLLPLINSTRYTLQFIISTAVTKLYSFDVSDEVMKEMDIVISMYIEKHVDRKMKSLEVINSMEGGL